VIISVQQNNDNEFQVVRNRVKLTRNIQFAPITIYNHFQILQVEKEKEFQETRIVGDLIVKCQLLEWYGRVSNQRKCFCMSGARLNEATRGTSNNDLFNYPCSYRRRTKDTIRETVGEIQEDDPAV